MNDNTSILDVDLNTLTNKQLNNIRFNVTTILDSMMVGIKEFDVGTPEYEDLYEQINECSKFEDVVMDACIKRIDGLDE